MPLETRMLPIRTGLLAFIAASVAACGGNDGGSTNTPPPPPPLQAPQVVYPQATYVFTTDVAVATITPTVTGGAPTGWASVPALPAGLTLGANGQITGTPTQAAAAGTFAITASNSAGQSSFNLSLAVKSGVLIDLGHTAPVDGLRYDGSRILSRDARTWALWNAATGEKLASGRPGNCPSSCQESIALGGNTAVIAGTSELLVRSATDGAALWSAPLAAGDWFALASDGSYVALGNSTGLVVRARGGAQLFQIAGNHGAARAFAAAGELRLANGPAGSSVIQRVAVPAGTSSNSAGFQGAFHSWFSDGQRFLSQITPGGAATTSTMWVYDTAGSQLAAGTLPTTLLRGGIGDRVYARVRTGVDPNDLSAELRIYSFGPAFTEVASFPLPQFANDWIPSGNTLGVIIDGSRSLAIVDMTPAMPTWTNVETPVSHVESYAAASSSDIAFGNNNGVVMRDLVGATPPQLYSHGALRGLAGSTTRFALSFSAGNVHYFDAATGTVQGVIELPAPSGAGYFHESSLRVQLSRDGNMLAVGYVDEDGMESRVTLYSLPNESVQNEFMFAAPDDLREFSLSESGNALTLRSGSANNGALNTVRLVEVDGTLLYSDTAYAGGSVLPSPSGARAAFFLAPVTSTSASRVIENGSLAGTLTGALSGWLDEQRLIVNRYQTDAFGFLVYDGAQIVDVNGQVQATVALPRITNGFQSVTASQIYAPRNNQILDVTNANVVWSSANTDPAPSLLGAVAGNFVVFPSVEQVRIEPFR
jgi:hypothetical protein